MIKMTNKQYNNWEEVLKETKMEKVPNTPLPTVQKYYKKMFDGIHELGTDYRIHDDVFNLIWEMLPDKFNMEYVLDQFDYIFLTEIEMMLVDMIGQNMNGAREFDPKNWWVWLWFEDLVYDMRKDEAFYLPLNTKSKDEYAHWAFSLDSSEIIENSAIRAKQRAEKWVNKI